MWWSFLLGLGKNFGSFSFFTVYFQLATVFKPLSVEGKAQNKEIKWVLADGSPSPGRVTGSTNAMLAEVDRVVLGEKGDLGTLTFRDPDSFKAGEIHNHIPMWGKILENSPERDQILRWIQYGVNIKDFLQPFKGTFKGIKCDSPYPPSHRFKNHRSCEKFKDFISQTLTERIHSGAVRTWGEVGKVDPPWLVLPLTVEPNKPRLCVDARFLNLWMRDTPFKLDTLVSVPQFVYPGSYLSKIDDKSGYDHVLLSEDSQQYFGIEWKGWWLVGTTLPFGWKNSPFVYQSIGLSSTTFLRERGITCSLYIDDRLIGEIFGEKGRWSRSMELRDKDFSQEAAMAALYITCVVLTSLGYFLGLKKCTLLPTVNIQFLGMIIDTHAQAFSIPQDKRVKFAELREAILSCKMSTPLKSIQRLMGKCSSFSLAFPGARFYIREMAASTGKASRGSEVVLSKGLREEIEFWRFLDSWDRSIPWRQERHVSLRMSTDASSFRWAATLHLASGDKEIGDYWTEDLRKEHINVKELYAVLQAIRSLPDSVRDCRVDVNVDNQVTLHTWQGRGPKSLKLTQVARLLFHVITERNLSLQMTYVPSGSNPADYFSRHLSRSDAMLSQNSWEAVQRAFGGREGHNLDLMSLDSNVQRDHNGAPLRHFTPFPTPFSDGVNVFTQDLTACDGERVNAYVYPPFSLISPLLRLIRSSRATVTMVVPKLSPLPIWWPIINAMSRGKLQLAQRGSLNAVLFPTKQGLELQRLHTELWMFRVGPC